MLNKTYGTYQPNKTFFPQHWTRETLIKKVFEAYDDFVAKGAKAVLDKGKYRIQGYTAEQIKVEMLITQNGQITSAYPMLEL